MSVAGTGVKPRYHKLRVSREEYLDLMDDGFKYDMIEGVLYMTPSPDFEHGKAANILNCLIRNYSVKQTNFEHVIRMEKVWMTC